MAEKIAPQTSSNLDGAKKLFIQEVIVNTDELRVIVDQDITQEEVDKLRKILHKIKGGVGFFAFHEMEQTINALNKQCIDYGNYPDKSQWLQQFKEHLRTLSNLANQLIVTDQ